MLEGRQVARWLASRAGWRADVLRDRTSPLWVDALWKTKLVEELCRVQRSALINNSKAYRTVSHAVLCVLTGTMSIHIRARWGGKVFEVKKLVWPDLEDPKDSIRSSCTRRKLWRHAERNGLIIIPITRRGDWSMMQPTFGRGREVSTTSPCRCWLDMGSSTITGSGLTNKLTISGVSVMRAKMTPNMCY